MYALFVTFLKRFSHVCLRVIIVNLQTRQITFTFCLINILKQFYWICKPYKGDVHESKSTTGWFTEGVQRPDGHALRKTGA